jgi:hypothetical protein
MKASKASVLALVLTCTLLFSTCRCLPLSPEWVAWRDALALAHLPGEAVFEHSAESQLSALCRKTHPLESEQAEKCVVSNLEKFKNQRGKENGIFVSPKAAEGCYSAAVSSEGGEITYIHFDSHDVASDVAREISFFLNASVDGPSFAATVQYMANNIAAVPAAARHRVCQAAITRREASALSAREALSAVGAVGAGAPAPGGDLRLSSFRCEYPFERREWLLPEMNALLPLGTCLFANMYLHNNIWYFLSDEAVTLPLLRLNTRSIEFRALTYAYKPTVIGTVAFRELMRTSVKRFSAEEMKVSHGVLVLLHRLTNGNHGHALFDGVLPIMWALHAHNLSLPTEAEDLLVALVDADSRDYVDDRLRIVSPRLAPAYRREHPAGLLCSPGTWCRYDRVLAGAGGFGIEHYLTQSKQRFALYKALRKQTAHVVGYPYLDINNDFKDDIYEPTYEASSVPHVLIVQRYGNRAFSIDALAFMKKTILEKHPSAIITVMFFENTSFEEQALLMQNISLMIAVDGTAVDNALFMPPCTGVLAIGRDVLNSEQYILNDGFEMHSDHFALWSQWLSLELIESRPGSWAADRRARGPLAGLGWDEDLRRQFVHALDGVLHKRKACAIRNGCKFSATRLCSSSTGRSTGSAGDMDSRESGGGVCPAPLSSLAPVPRPMHGIRTLLSPSDFPAASDIIGKVILHGDSNWYQISDFWQFSVSSSVLFISDLYNILKPHFSGLVNDENVFIINSGDGFIPLLSFFGRCKTLEVLEVSVPGNVASLLDLFNTIFSNIKIFFQHLLRIDIYNVPESFLSREDIDTLFVMTGASLADVFPCKSSGPCSLTSSIPALANRTRKRLVLEYIPSNCMCSGDSGTCGVATREEIDLLEDALRDAFMSFFLAGFVDSSCSFVYIASDPLIKVSEKLSISTTQGLIVSPESGSLVLLPDGQEVALSVVVLVAGPAEVLRSMKAMDRAAASEQVERQAIDAFISPRLFVDRNGGRLMSGCGVADDVACFGKYTVQAIGNQYKLSFTVIISEPGEYDITFQILKNAKRIYKAHFTPELVCQHSVTVHAKMLERG